jgi:hypothetical protein
MLARKDDPAALAVQQELVGRREARAPKWAGNIGDLDEGSSDRKHSL